MSFEEKPKQETEKSAEATPAIPTEPSTERVLELEANYYAHLDTIDSQLKELDIEIQNLEDSANIPSENGVAEIELKTAYAKKERLHAERVTAEANFPGDWTQLLHDRMLDPLTKEKFISQRTLALKDMKEGTPSLLEKPKMFRAHYEEQIQNYDATVDEVFSSTRIGNATEFNKRPYHLGTGNIGEQGAVFSDAEHADRRALTDRQKNIIEAHEKGHGMRDFTSPKDSAELRAVLDTETLEEIARSAEVDSEKRFSKNYLSNPEEIAERMAQLKNYFGMRASDVFTKAHLDYTREHYVADTGLDNDMSTFLSCISPRTEGTFLSVINKYPL